MTLEKTLQNLRKTKEGYFNVKIYFEHSNFYFKYFHFIDEEKIKKLFGNSIKKFVISPKYYLKKNMIIYGFNSRKPYIYNLETNGVSRR